MNALGISGVPFQRGVNALLLDENGLSQGAGQGLELGPVTALQARDRLAALIGFQTVPQGVGHRQ